MEIHHATTPAIFPTNQTHAVEVEVAPDTSWHFDYAILFSFFPQWMTEPTQFANIYKAYHLIENF